MSLGGLNGVLKITIELYSDGFPVFNRAFHYLLGEYVTILNFGDEARFARGNMVTIGLYPPNGNSDYSHDYVAESIGRLQKGVVMNLMGKKVLV